MNKFETETDGYIPESKTEVRKFKGLRPRTTRRLVAAILICLLIPAGAILLQEDPEKTTPRREIARFPLKLGEQTVGPAIVPTGGWPAAHFELQAESSDSGNFEIDYEYGLLDPWGQSNLEGAQQIARSYHASLVRNLFASPRRTRFGQLPIAFLGPAAIRYNIKTMTGIDKLEVVVYEAQLPEPPGEPEDFAQPATPKTFREAARFLGAADARERDQGHRFLRHYWWANRDEKTSVTATLETLCQPRVEARPIYMTSGTIPVDLKGVNWTALRALQGPFVIRGGIEIDSIAQQEYFSLNCATKEGAFDARKNLAPPIDAATTGPHNLLPYWTLERSHDDPALQGEILWKSEWLGEQPVQIELAEELPESMLRFVSSPELDAEMRNALYFKSESPGQHVKNRKYLVRLIAARPLPAAIEGEICVILNNAPPFRVGDVSLKKDETGEAAARFLLTDLRPGTYTMRFLLRPTQDEDRLKKRENEKFWGGTFDSSVAQTIRYLPRDAGVSTE